MCKKPDINQMFFRTLSFFSSDRFPRRWLHTFIKQFILWFLWGMSASNHKLYICFFDNLVPAKLRFPYAKQHVRYTQNEMHTIKSGQCLTRTIFDTRSYRFHYRFVIVLVHVPHAANYQNIGSPLDHTKWLQHMDHRPVSNCLEKNPETNGISSCCCFEHIP